MTELDLLVALEKIDPSFIAASAPDAPLPLRVKKPWIKSLSRAACLCLAVGLSLLAVIFITGDMAETGPESIYLIGGVTLNMTNMVLAFFLAPLFSLLCTLLLWCFPSGGIFLLLWLLRAIGIPLLHFCLVRRAVERNRLRKPGNLLLALLLIVAAVIADSLLLDIILVKGQLSVFHLAFRLIWTVICGLLVLGHTVILRFYRGTTPHRIAVSAGAAAALLVNAFLMAGMSHGLAARFHIDGIEILLWPIALILLSAYSYLLGQILTRRLLPLKLTAWLSGILASEYVVFWLLGTPRTPPTADPFTAILWLALSAIPFLFCLLGMLRTSRRRQKTDP